MKFEDTLEAIGVYVRNPTAEDRDIHTVIENIVNKFKAYLKNKARRWYETSIGTNPTSVQEWEDLKRKFKAQYNPKVVLKNNKLKLRRH